MKFFQIIPSETHINFISKFRVFLLFSILAGVAIVAGVATKGLNYGIDFTGGTVVQIRFNESHNAEAVRKLLSGMGEPDASVVALGQESLEYLITARTAQDIKGQESLDKKLGALTGLDKLEVQKVDIVGPKVGAELKRASLLALFYSIVFITIYIWLRFDFRFAPGATIAMVHDLIMVAGFYLVTGKEFTITAVAALLTIAGYSVNDTIVIYDRVRELLKKGGEALPIPETINRAVNLTLSRTLLTAGVTFISIVPIMFFCEGEIQSFAMAMCFGIFVGSYSTIYIASPFAIYVQKILAKRKSAGAARTVTA